MGHIEVFQVSIPLTNREVDQGTCKWLKRHELTVLLGIKFQFQGRFPRRVERLTKQVIMMILKLVLLTAFYKYVHKGRLFDESRKSTGTTNSK